MTAHIVELEELQKVISAKVRIYERYLADDGATQRWSPSDPGPARQNA